MWRNFQHLVLTGLVCPASMLWDPMLSLCGSHTFLPSWDPVPPVWPWYSQSHLWVCGFSFPGLLSHLSPPFQPSSLPDLASGFALPHLEDFRAWALALWGRPDHLIVFSSVVRVLFNSWVFLLWEEGQITPACQVIGLDKEVDLATPGAQWVSRSSYSISIEKWLFFFSLKELFKHFNHGLTVWLCGYVRVDSSACGSQKKLWDPRSWS